MRLFIAVDLPDAIVAAAAAVAATLRDRVIGAAPQTRCTWIPPDRMHLTVRFLGAVDAAQAAMVVAALAEPLDVEPFELTLAAPGVFPPRGAPRVVWLGIDKGRASLLRVEQQISKRLEAVGVHGEARPFSPHLTLARVREPAGLRGTAWLDGVTAPQAPGSVVDAITLFESRLSPNGPTYTALQRTPLRRA